MASEVSVANSALIKLGSRQRVTSLTQTNSVTAALCNEQFPKIRDELLEMAHWKFAMKWASLTRTANTPTAEYDYEYQRPNDIIRIVKVSDNDAGVGTVPYRMMADTIISDSNTLYLLYVRKETDPNIWSALFREAFAWKLAYDLAMAVTDATNTRAAMEKDVVRAVARAKASDAMQNFPETMPYGSWVTSRQRDADQWWDDRG